MFECSDLLILKFSADSRSLDTTCYNVIMFIIMNHYSEIPTIVSSPSGGGRPCSGAGEDQDSCSNQGCPSESCIMFIWLFSILVL